MSIRNLASAVAAVVCGSIALGAALALTLSMLSGEAPASDRVVQTTSSEVVLFKTKEGIASRQAVEPATSDYDDNGPFLSIMRRLTEGTTLRYAGASVACSEQSSTLLGKTYDLLFGEASAQSNRTIQGIGASASHCDSSSGLLAATGEDRLVVKTPNGVIADLGLVPKVVPSLSLD